MKRQRGRVDAPRRLTAAAAACLVAGADGVTYNLAGIPVPRGGVVDVAAPFGAVPGAVVRLVNVSVSWGSPRGPANGTGPVHVAVYGLASADRAAAAFRAGGDFAAAACALPSLLRFEVPPPGAAPVSFAAGVDAKDVLVVRAAACGAPGLYGAAAAAAAAAGPVTLSGTLVLTNAALGRRWAHLSADGAGLPGTYAVETAVHGGLTLAFAAACAWGAWGARPRRRGGGAGGPAAAATAGDTPRARGSGDGDEGGADGGGGRGVGSGGYETATAATLSRSESGGGGGGGGFFLRSPLHGAAAAGDRAAGGAASVVRGGALGGLCSGATVTLCRAVHSACAAAAAAAIAGGVRSLLLASLLLRLLELALTVLFFARYGAAGDADDASGTASSVVGYASNAVFCVTLMSMAFALGEAPRAPATARRARGGAAAFLALYAFLGALRTACASPAAHPGVPAPAGGLGGSLTCDGVDVVEYVVRSVALLGAVFAVNFHVTTARVALTASDAAWDADATPRAYALERRLRHFRRVFMAVLTLPPLLYVVRLSSATWEFAWVNTALSEAVVVGGYGALAALYAPRTPLGGGGGAGFAALDAALKEARAADDEDAAAAAAAAGGEGAGAGVGVGLLAGGGAGVGGVGGRAGGGGAGGAARGGGLGAARRRANAASGAPAAAPAAARDVVLAEGSEPFI